MEGWLQSQALALGLVLARFGGLVMAAPLLSSVLVPIRLRAMIAVALAAMALPMLPATAVQGVPTDAPGLALVVLGEITIGAAMGLMVTLVLAAMELAGFLAAYQLGLSVAGAYNPDLGTESNVLGELMYMAALAILVIVGGLDALCAGLMASFAGAPIGAMSMGEAPVGVIVAALTAGFELAMRFAMPVLACAGCVLIAMGVLGRTVPGINAMTVGFAVKIIVGLLALVFTIALVERTLGEAIVSGVADATRWAERVGAAGEPR